MPKKQEFYSLNRILKENADYNVIYGERSNGKTTAVLKLILFGFHEDGININGYVDDGSQGAIIRRWEEDYKSSKGQQIFQNIINLDWVAKYTKNRYNTILYYSQRWYLAKFNEFGEKEYQDTTPFCYAFAISSEEHYKMNAFPKINNILFDEFLTRSYYIPDEFIKFQNLLSTIIRHRDNVKIFMCGNTINKFCPYFAEMGLTNVKKQEIGKIDVYLYGQSTLKVAVEYSDFPGKKKASNKYFAFNNPKLKMITEGGWEIDIYPHLEIKYLPKDVIYKFYICFDEQIVQGNIVSVNDNIILYLHRKTTPIKENNEQLVYNLTPTFKFNYSSNILKPKNKIEKIIYDLFKYDKVFYQDNEIGEIIKNYINVCRKN